MKNRLEIRSLAYAFQGTDKDLFSDFSSTLEAGTLICLVGPNGSGKSTLLSCLAGFSRPRSGEILHDSQDLSSMPIPARAERLSVSLTETVRGTHITVFEYASLGHYRNSGAFGGLTQAQKDSTGKALDAFGIAALSDRRLSTLSDGERQKATLARVLVQDTPIIILDEPTSFLDEPCRQDIMELFRREATASGKIILVALHELSLALRHADGLWVFDPVGKRDLSLPVTALIHQTEPDKVRDSGLLATAYGRDSSYRFWQ